MRNTLKTLGILCIIAAALFIAACGDLPEADSGFTVTFNSDGGSSVPSQSFEKDSAKTLTKPTDPTKTELTDPGLYRDFAGYKFEGWFDSSGSLYTAFGSTPTESFTLKAKWSIPDANKVSLGTGTGDDVTKAFAAVKAAAGKTATTQFTLYINAPANPTGALVLDGANSKLTIISDRERNIKSPILTNKVFITVGGTKTDTPLDTSISLTLKNVAVVGSDTATGDSLIRVQNGASLTLENKATIEGHKNNIDAVGGTNTSSGKNGNGSAICVINGSTLTIKEGAYVWKNESTGVQPNKNLVGGIYVIGSPLDTVPTNPVIRSTVNIEGGYIKENKCTDGNTADIYITEDVVLHMKGNLTIGELAINTDKRNNGANYIYPDFYIDGKVTNTIDKLNLRSSFGDANTAAADILTGVQAAWTNATVFKGTATYDITSSDVAQFKLWEFAGRKSLRGDTSADTSKWKNLISPAYKIELVDKSGSTPNYGKLVKVTTP